MSRCYGPGERQRSAADAVKSFRERQAAATSTSSEPERPPAGAETPEAGVYAYAAIGTETVKLGPLPEQVRPLPATVSAVVVGEGTGCFDMTVNYFAEHTEDSRWCAKGRELRWVRHLKHQRVGAISPTATVTCDPDVVRAADGSPRDLSCGLELAGGPVAVSTASTARRPPAQPRRSTWAVSRSRRFPPRSGSTSWGASRVPGSKRSGGVRRTCWSRTEGPSTSGVP
ncbi:MAG: hypothetical protein R2698_12125 [Microthrixaceae bacterium]